MKANELRIGNWLNWNGSPSQIQSGGIHLFEEGKLHIEPKPIPLTEEWLVRFGFEKNEYNAVNSIDKAISGCDYYKDSTSIRLSLYDDVCKKGVHWFQNWYFFETGEELKLNER